MVLGLTISTRLSLVALLAVGSGCSQSNFGASTGSASHSASGDGADGANGANGAGSNGSDNGNGNGTGGNTDAGNGSGGANDGGQGTCKHVATNYNVMFMFDNTGSQLQTDPSYVRRSGALAFVDQFSAYVGKFPAAQVYMGVLSFAVQSIRANNGWLLLKPDSVATIKQEIVTATTNPGGMTAYSPVLKDGASFFAQVNSLPTANKALNYVVFLTDGEPDADTPAAIKAAVDNLVNTYDVAVIAIATGPQVSAAGEKVVKALALPTTAGKFPGHVGQYFRAADPSALTNVWGQLLAAIGGC